MKKIFILIIAVSYAATTFAAYDAFLRLGDIKGEATDKDHKDWIEISSYATDPSHGANPTAGGSNRTPAKFFNAVTVRARVGKWTPQVAQAVATGKQFSNVVLDAGPMRYTYDEVIITSFSAGGGSNLEATFKMQYNKVTMAATQLLKSSVVTPPMAATTTVTPNITPVALTPNAQLYVDGARSDEFTLISFDRSQPTTATLHLRNAPSGGFLANNRTKNDKVSIKSTARQFLDITMSNCVISSYSRNADGTATATLTFSLFSGPVSVRP